MSPDTKPIAELTLADIPRAGGKACRLGELLRAGLPVPRGFAILAGAYEAFLEQSGLTGKLRGLLDAAAAPAGLAALRRAIEAAPFPAGPAAEITRALREAGLGDGVPLAVRSSAPGEDGAFRSRAGVYESHLNVTGERGVLEAIKACWASLWTERSLAYAAEGADPAMAVLVQEMIPCDVSGILFTLNPLTGDENEMLVEATPGLAAGLASGEVDPDRFVVDFWDGAVRRREAAPARAAAACLGAPCLDAKQLGELAALGRRAQLVFGCPQDLEFGFAGGRVFLLQARPITAYSFPPETGQWTTANFREVMPGFASVLGQSQSFWYDFSRAQEELFKRLRLWRPAVDEGTVWSRTIFGHGYWNAGATKRVAARIPGYVERSMDRTIGIEPAYEGNGQVTPWNLRTIAGAIPVLLALGKQYEQVPREAEAFIRWFDAEEPAWDEVRPAELDDPALAGRVAWGLELHAQANRWALITSLLSTQAQEDFHRTLDGLARKLARRRLLSRWLGGRSIHGNECPSEARLMTGLDRMATARPLFDLWQLAQGLKRRPEMVRVLRDTPPAELAGLFAQGTAAGGDGAAGDGAAGDGAAGDDGWQAIAGWLRRYRHMSNIDEDLSVPRWWEDPSVPLAMLRGYVLEPGGKGAGGETGADPERQVKRQVAVREKEEAKARALGRRWLALGLDPFWWGRFAKQYRLVKSLCWWREETRVYLSKARYHCRRFLVEQSRRWAEAGQLETADDIFWLTRDEVLDLVGHAAGVGAPSAPSTGAGGFASAREMVRRRKSVSALYRNFRVPPDIAPGAYGADGLPLRAAGGSRTSDAGRSDAAATANGADRAGARHPGAIHAGVGCSAGRVTAPCRVVHCIEEAAALEAGEILVAPYANPAWTPLFHLAAGLVLEEGGLLSHSAVVAREYGVPAVLQVKGATRIFRTGDILTIDGIKGTVVAAQRPA